jgi:hypothetical protein
LNKKWWREDQLMQMRIDTGVVEEKRSATANGRDTI